MTTDVSTSDRNQSLDLDALFRDPMLDASETWLDAGVISRIHGAGARAVRMRDRFRGVDAADVAQECMLSLVKAARAGFRGGASDVAARGEGGIELSRPRQFERFVSRTMRFRANYTASRLGGRAWTVNGQHRIGGTVLLSLHEDTGRGGDRGETLVDGLSDPAAEDPRRAAELDDEKCALLAAIDALPERLRRTIVALSLEDVAPQRLAEEERITTNGVFARRDRALSLLRETLTQQRPSSAKTPKT